MDWSSPWIWVPVLAIGIVLVIGIRTYSSRKRNKKVRRVLVGMGFRPGPRKAFSKAAKKKLPLLRKGHSGIFSRVFVKEGPAEIIVFDYRYTFGIPLLAARYVWQTVVAISVRDTGLPDFQLAPATSLDKVGWKIGSDRIRTGDDQFDGRYWLRGRDVRGIEYVFRPPIPHIIASHDPEHMLSVEHGGDWLLVFAESSMLDPSAIPRLITTAGELGNELSNGQHKVTR